MEFSILTMLQTGGDVTLCSEGCKKAMDLKNRFLGLSDSASIENGDIRDQIRDRQNRILELEQANRQLKRTTQEAMIDLLKERDSVLRELVGRIEADEDGQYISVRIGDLSEDFREFLSPKSQNYNQELLRELARKISELKSDDEIAFAQANDPASQWQTGRKPRVRLSFETIVVIVVVGGMAALLILLWLLAYL